MAAGGFTQAEIIYGPEVATGTLPTIASTLTVLCGPFDARIHAMLAGTLENVDLTQTLQGMAQSSWDGLTKWTDVRQFYDLADIVPGEIRPFSLDTTAFRYVRFTGTASGAGIVGAQMRILRAYSNSGARGPYQRW